MTFPNVVSRYAILRDLAWQTANWGILEVGSGAEGLAAFVSQPFVGCDLAFRSRPSAPMFPVRGSACNLPFSDEAFDIVICMDALEHIPLSLRSLALREMVRVAKYRAIIGFPSGRGAYAADQFLTRVYRWLRLDIPDWLHDHQELFPTLLEAKKALEPLDGIRVHFRWAESLPLHLVIMLLEMHPRVLDFLQRSAQRHRRTWLSAFRYLNVWPCYRLVCIVDRNRQDIPPVASREPLW